MKYSDISMDQSVNGIFFWFYSVRFHQSHGNVILILHFFKWIRWGRRWRQLFDQLSIWWLSGADEKLQSASGESAQMQILFQLHAERIHWKSHWTQAHGTVSALLSRIAWTFDATAQSISFHKMWTLSVRSFETKSQSTFGRNSSIPCNHWNDSIG